jgi:Tfp pilus assembly protein PilF
VSAAPVALPFSLETFTLMFANVAASSVDLMIIWDQTAVTLPIKMDVDSKVMAQIDNSMNKDNKPYYQSAMYYMETGKDLNKASQWFDKAIEQNPSAYWVWHQKANCLAKLGKKNEAIAAANKSMELATAAKNGDYVTLNKKLLATLK